MELLDSDIVVTKKIDQEVPQNVIEELRIKLPDFARAYDEDGMVISEVAEYGPVQLFRNSFIKGWYQILAQIAHRKHLLAK